MKRTLLLFMFLATPAFAEPTTLQKCEALLSTYVRLKVDVEQAGLALNVQRSITELCQKLIEAEKPKPEAEVPVVKEPAK